MTPLDSLSVPEHVPAHLVYDYDRFETPALYEVPQFSLAKKLREEAPPIFYAPRQQMWVVSDPGLIADMLRKPDMFSSDPKYCTWRDEMPVRQLPTAYDPPDHAEARAIIQPMFSAKAILEMEEDIRGLSAAIIDEVTPKGGCEFVGEVAKHIPVVVFLKMAGAPLQDREYLLDIVERYLHASDSRAQLVAANDMTEYLRGLLEQRRVSPGDDLITRLHQGTMLGRRLTEDEILGASFLLFLAGLDTVAAVLSFTMRFLARNPTHYEQLVQNPELIPNVIEEILRTDGVGMPERGARGDFEYEGVKFKSCDHILFLSNISGMHPSENDEPERVDFTRKVSRHAIFGTGPHRCIGMNLARLELRVVLQEWVKRIPAFHIKGDARIKVLGGVVWIPAAVPLEWDHVTLAS